jgi:hypothetical protein
LLRLDIGLFGSQLTTIPIPASVGIIGENCFDRCLSFELVKVESNSRLQRIEEYVFVMNRPFPNALIDID